MKRYLDIYATPRLCDALVFLAVFASSFLALIYTGNFESIKLDDTMYVHTADDHMITLRVARNFFVHGDPYFNLNDAVAANTSLFWPMILGSVIFVAGHTNAVIINILLSCMVSAATVSVSTLLVKEIPLKIFVAIFLVMSPTFLSYGATGWEHVPQTFLVTLAFYLAFRSTQAGAGIPFATVLVLSLSFVFRPDSAFMIVGVGALWFFSNSNYKKTRSYVLGAALLAIPALYLFTMNHYYGDFLPNTAYLKNLEFWNALKSGMLYVLNPYRSGAFLVLIALLVFLNSGGRFFLLVLVAGISHLVYVVLSGGDVFHDGRFFMVLLPILTVAVVNELRRVFLSKDHSSIAVPCLLIVSTIFWNHKNVMKDIFVDSESPTIERIRIAHDVNDLIESDEGVIGLHYLGSGYHFDKFDIIDFLGKADSHIARTEVKFGPVGHNKWDYDYAFENYDIAVIPMSQRTVSDVTAEDFSIENKDFMFWNVATAKIIETDNYVYLAPELFGNRSTGAFVRKDLAPRFSETVE